MKKSTSITIIILILLIISAVLLYSAAQSHHSPSLTTPIGTITSTTTTVTTVPADFVPYTSTLGSFSFSYPSDLATLTPGTPTSGQDWVYDATVQEPGTLDVTVSIPASFEPKTNFAGARFTVGSSANSVAIAQCLAIPQGNPIGKSTAVINGVTFTKFTYSDAGAGNFYDVTSYRTIHAGECYAVEYIVHSADIGNYDPSQGISMFDESKVQAVLDQVVATFKFN